MDRYFSTPRGGEPIEVFLKWGSVSEKLTVFISFRKPRKMRRAIEESGCINHRNFDVVVERGPDLRYVTGRGIHPEYRNHPLSIPDLPGYASGLPIRSFREGEPLGTALIGGVIRIDGRLWGLTVFHFLKGSWKKDSTVAENERELEISTSRECSDTSSLWSVHTATTDPASPLDTQLDAPLSDVVSDVEVYLQPWTQLETTIAEVVGGEPIQMRIRSTSGTRLSEFPYYQPGNTSLELGDLDAEDIRCIMDWALVDLGEIPLLSNSYADKHDGDFQLKTVRTTTDPGDKAVDILVEGGVYCKGVASGIPCLLGLQNTRGYGLAFMISTDSELRELFPFEMGCNGNTDEGTCNFTGEGISGAWIVDSNTSELIGHLFAVSTPSNRGYFIPINETFKDIGATLNADKVHVQVVLGEQLGDTANSARPSLHNPYDSGHSTETPHIYPITAVQRQTTPESLLQKVFQGVKRSFTVSSIQKHQLLHTPDPLTPLGFRPEIADQHNNCIDKSLGGRFKHVWRGLGDYIPTSKV